MHQVSSCKDDCLDVFTTVLSPKALIHPSVARNPIGCKHIDSKRVRHKTVVATCDYQPHWSDELVLCHGDVIQVLYKDDEVWWFGRLQNGQQGYFPSTYVSKHKETNEKSAAKVTDNNQPVGLPLSEPGRYNKVKRSQMFEKSQALPLIQASFRPGVIPEPTTDVSSFTQGKQKKSEKNIRKYPVLALESDASVPLTGDVSHTTPSILRRIIMKNKKKAACSGATNNAFEPD